MQYAASVNGLDDQLASGNPYCLDVFTTTIHGVVADAGGWILDRILSGWRVTFIVDIPDDGERVGRILGAKVMTRGAASDCLRPLPYGIALTSSLYGTDTGLRTCITDALNSELTEITLVGSQSGEERDPRLGPVNHRLSCAAKAFKLQALFAAGLPAHEMRDSERFYRAETSSRRSAHREGDRRAGKAASSG
jgi:hypothetical protein